MAAAPATKTTKVLVWTMGIAGAFMVLLLVWRPWHQKEVRRQAEENQPAVSLPVDTTKAAINEDVGQQQPPDQGEKNALQDLGTEKPQQKQSVNLLPTDTEAADFEVVRKAGTIPALRNFLRKKYPRAQYAGEAKRMVVALESRIKTLLSDASQFPDDSKTACELLRQAAAIDPENAQVLKKQNEVGCHGRNLGG